MHTDSVIQLPHKQRGGEEAFQLLSALLNELPQKHLHAEQARSRCTSNAKRQPNTWTGTETGVVAFTWCCPKRQGVGVEEREKERDPREGSKALPLIQMRHFCLAALWRLHIQAGAAPAPAPPAAAPAASLVIMSGVDYALCSMQRHKDCSTEEQTSDNCSVH